MPRFIPKVVVFALLACGAVAGHAPQPPAEQPDVPVNRRPYFLAFWVKGEKAAETQTAEERSALFRQHLAFIRAQIESGKFVLAGPLMDDGQMRGIAIIRAASAADAREIASGDPMVKTGRLGIEVHPAMLPDLSCVRVEYKK